MLLTERIPPSKVLRFMVSTCYAALRIHKHDASSLGLSGHHKASSGLCISELRFEKNSGKSVKQN